MVFGAPYSSAREQTPSLTTSKSSASTKDSRCGAGEQRTAMIERAAKRVAANRQNLSRTKMEKRPAAVVVSDGGLGTRHAPRATRHARRWLSAAPSRHAPRAARHASRTSAQSSELFNRCVPLVAPARRDPPELPDCRSRSPGGSCCGTSNLPSTARPSARAARDWEGSFRAAGVEVRVTGKKEDDRQTLMQLVLGALNSRGRKSARRQTQDRAPSCCRCCSCRPHLRRCSTPPRRPLRRPSPWDRTSLAPRSRPLRRPSRTCMARAASAL